MFNEMDIQQSAGPLTLKVLAENALEANKAHQYALTKYAERLAADLQEIDKLMVSNLFKLFRPTSDNCWPRAPWVQMTERTTLELRYKFLGRRKLQGHVHYPNFWTL
jgi:hypothetical protein